MSLLKQLNEEAGMEDSSFAATHEEEVKEETPREALPPSRRLSLPEGLEWSITNKDDLIGENQDLSALVGREEHFPSIHPRVTPPDAENGDLFVMPEDYDEIADIPQPLVRISALTSSRNLEPSSSGVTSTSEESVALQDSSQHGLAEANVESIDAACESNSTETTNSFRRMSFSRRVVAADCQEK